MSADDWVGRRLRGAQFPWTCCAYSFHATAFAKRRKVDAIAGSTYSTPPITSFFLVDGVPLRFFQGDDEDSSKRTLRQQGIEAQQLALALGATKRSEDLMFCPAVKTREGGEVTRVVFLAVRGEEGTMKYF